MTPEEFVDLFGREKASAILRTDDQENAARAMDAAIAGGFRILEFTLTGPGALERIRDYAQRQGYVVGAGTVLTADDATRAVAAGARFLVSPVVDEKVIAAAAELGVASMPGTHTATEMLLAHRAGAQLCKLFPAPAGGPAYVKATLGPLPFLKIVPTNGVDHRNAGAWMAAGCHGVGFVATLFDPEFMATGNWDAIEERAAACLAAARGG
jgi:Entner-Doudoroff aldolase